MRQHPKQRSKLRRGHTHHRAPITESQGAAVPWFEAMADVAMEIDGKAAEGWVSSSSCWLLFVLCGCVLWWTVLSATQHVEIETWSGTSQNGPLLLHHKIKHTAKPPKVMTCTSLSWFEDEENALTFGQKSCFGHLLMRTKTVLRGARFS